MKTRVLTIILLLVLIASIAWGDGVPPQDSSSALEAAGYPASEYAVAIAWRERAPQMPITYVNGYHLQPLDGGDAVDVYLSDSSELLTESTLAVLGIQPKQWDRPAVQQPAEPTGPATKAVVHHVNPIGPKHALPISGAALLDDLDLDAVLAEDAARDAEFGKGPQRIGVIQDLSENIMVEGDTATHGFWQPVSSGGYLWSAALYSPDALGIRVHFEQIELPAGATVVVYNANNPDEAHGPYPASGTTANDLWSATCFTDMVVVECFVPANASRDVVRITIDRIVHNYVPFGELTWTKSAGDCNVDVSCYPDWADAATGVGGVGSVGYNGSFFCSGCLLADTDTSTDVPYFLTANHCVSTESEASSLEIYWLYQTSTCNGVPPNPATVPRTTGGAALLATTTADNGTDFCLLRLNNDPPAGLTAMGWSSVPTPLTTTTVCIHHPSADYKRITFGVVTDVNEALRDLRPATRFYQSSWTLGTTEPGSSGSPLFIASTQQVIGQLWGGPGSCTTSTNLDYFGRFDVGFPLMAAYLDPDITPMITISQPNGTENWPLGERKKIHWVSTGDVGPKVQIELWRNGGLVQVLRSNTNNDGKAGWNIDSALEPGDGYSIRILSKSNPSIFDDSDAPFSLYDPTPVDPGDTTTHRWPLLWFILNLLGLV